jgi:putative ABC transport system permease protein
MYTQCPDCQTLFTVTVENLRAAMGMVRCTHCATVFNALTGLREAAEIDTSQAESVGNQLAAVTAFGDEQVIDPKFLASRDWFVRSVGPTPAESLTQSIVDAAHQRASAAAVPVPAHAPAPLEVPEPTDTTQVGEPWSSRVLRTLLGETFSLALRNLSRHRRRTALGVGAIGFGVVALVLAGGFAEWMKWAERESTIHSRLGHIQIVRNGYYENGVADPYAYLIPDAAVNSKRLMQLPHVKTVTPRLAYSGLISKGETTVSFLGEGIVPETEADVSKEVIVHDGEPLSSEQPKGVILGKGLALSLGAEVGDSVVLLTTTGSGSVSAVEANVSGIFHTAVKAFDDVALRTPIGLARELTKAEGSHQLIVLLDETERTDEVLNYLRQLVPAGKSALQIIPWIDLADFYKAVVELFASQMNFVRTIIAIIIIMSISNTLVMSVMERTSEIGTLMAIGYRQRKVMQLFVSEGFVIGVAGGIAGVVFGYALAEVISAVGIPMPPAPGMDQGFTAAIRMTWELLLGGFLVAVVSAVVASLYPAWKASRLEIVDALRRAR